MSDRKEEELTHDIKKTYGYEESYYCFEKDMFNELKNRNDIRIKTVVAKHFCHIKILKCRIPKTALDFEKNIALNRPKFCPIFYKGLLTSKEFKKPHFFTTTIYIIKIKKII